MFSQIKYKVRGVRVSFEISTLWYWPKISREENLEVEKFELKKLTDFN